MSAAATIRAGMVGLGMIFDETYRPCFEKLHAEGLFSREFGDLNVELTAVASLTGRRAEQYLRSAGNRIYPFKSYSGVDAVQQLLNEGAVDFVCVATPDNRHFEACQQVLQAGKHLLVEKPSVLSLQELDQLLALAQDKGVLAKVVYHKLLDPDHKKLRTLVADGILQHVNNGYCSLLEPKQISGSQFSEWITGRNPGTYVAVHYIKLIDFTFGGRLIAVQASGQRGIVGPADGPTWDSVQLKLIYQYESGREAAFDIHTSWVTPDNFPGYVEQEVQFRFDNGVWNAHSRKRGVECTVEGRTPLTLKTTQNNHYNGTFLEPWGVRSQRGYGVEVIDRFIREVAWLEHGGPATERERRLQQLRQLNYNDLAADRQVVAAVAAMEAILTAAAAGDGWGTVTVSENCEKLLLHLPGLAPRLVV